MALSPGARVGPYEVVSLLGRGGMGEVWRARDTRLDRDVALKTLPADLVADADRLSRFSREAKVLAQLSHPGIAAIHAVEEIGGQRLLIPIRAKGADLGRVYSLNGTAAAVWDRLTSPADAAELAGPLAKEYGAPAETVQTDLEELFAALAKRGLVTVAEGEG